MSEHSSRHHFIAASRAVRFSLESRPSVGAGGSAPSNGHAEITMPATVGESPLFTVLGTDTIGHADRVPILNMKIREDYVMLGDGRNTLRREVVLSSALGDGARQNRVDHAGPDPVQRCLSALLPTRYPFSIGASKMKGKGQGEHAYGPDLPDDQKDALVDALKTVVITTGGRAECSPPREGLA